MLHGVAADLLFKVDSGGQTGPTALCLDLCGPETVTGCEEHLFVIDAVVVDHTNRFIETSDSFVSSRLELPFFFLSIIDHLLFVAEVDAFLPTLSDQSSVPRRVETKGHVHFGSSYFRQVPRFVKTIELTESLFVWPLPLIDKRRPRHGPSHTYTPIMFEWGNSRRQFLLD